jgi:hypothetical protein
MVNINNVFTICLNKAFRHYLQQTNDPCHRYLCGRNVYYCMLCWYIIKTCTPTANELLISPHRDEKNNDSFQCNNFQKGS